MEVSRKLVTATALALLGGVSLAQAAPTYNPATDPNGNLIGLTTPNGRLVYDFINLWFNDHKSGEAFDKYVARHGYVNHAVYSATTKTMDRTFDQEKAQESQATGSTHFDIKQIISQGNLVFVHIAATQGPPPAGAGSPPGGANPPPGAGPGDAQGGGEIQGDHKGPDEMIMILRVHDGKIVDHWDLHVPTNSDSIVFKGLERKLP